MPKNNNIPPNSPLAADAPMTQRITWQLILNSLLRQTPVMLLYVLESKGSSPGRQGFFMAVNTDNEMSGSIGGGMMEHKLVELAKEKLRSGLNNNIVKKQVHDKTAATNQSGMICSGEQTVFLYEIKQSDSEHIKNIIQSLQENKSGQLILSADGMQFDNIIPKQNFSFYFINEKEWIYKEKTGYKNQLYIIGGGHCALALSRVMYNMDFYIRLYENRKDLHTLLQNDFVHEKIIVENYEQLADLIPSGASSYVVIMTFGYRTDDIALSTLLNKNFKYMGVLGSKKKMQRLFDQYRLKGIDEKKLAFISTPIGISIHSETPEEIAISIAAEIVRIKNMN